MVQHEDYPLDLPPTNEGLARDSVLKIVFILVSGWGGIKESPIETQQLVDKRDHRFDES